MIGARFASMEYTDNTPHASCLLSQKRALETAVLGIGNPRTFFSTIRRVKLYFVSVTRQPSLLTEI